MLSFVAAELLDDYGQADSVDQQTHLRTRETIHLLPFDQHSR